MQHVLVVDQMEGGGRQIWGNEGDLSYPCEAMGKKLKKKQAILYKISNHL